MVDWSALAAELAALTGLDTAVALNWLRAEGSVHPTNPLGILCGNSLGSGLEIDCEGRFARYRSTSDGLRATAWLLAHGSRYGGIRDAIASGTPVEQRAALVASPWAGGHYRNGAGFSLTGISGAAGPTGTPAAGPPGTDTRTLADFPFSALPPSTPFSEKLLRMLSGDIPVDNPDRAQLIATYRSYLGRPINEVPYLTNTFASLAGGLKDFPGAIGEAAGAVFGDLFAWVPGFVVNGAVLVTILVLGYVGIRRVAG